jgi:RNA polymerase sigma factor (sigma-70 family)
MADRSLPETIRDVLRRLKVKEVRQLPDAELLGRFVASRDDVAFTALVGRHGPTVLNVCRRVLRGHDVDDVFQATFLSLAKEAATIRQGYALGAWLYEVAYRISLRAKARRTRNEQVEHAAATAEGEVPHDTVLHREVQQVLDEELHQLPERLRKPLVLVHLLGHVQVDAARELGITDRALRKRLRAGRDRLRVQLTRRGIGLSTAGLAAVLDPSAAAGAVSSKLLRPTVDSILAYAAGHVGAVPAETVSLALAGAGAGGWLAGRAKLVLLVGVPILASLVLTASTLAPTGSKASGDARTTNPVLGPLRPMVAPPDAVNGPTTVLTGRVLGSDGQPVPHAAVTALVRRPWQSADRAQHDVIAAQGMTDSGGRYRLAVPAPVPSPSADRRVTLLAHASGHAAVTDEIRIDGRPASADLKLAGQATAAGRLVGPDGQPAVGVRLAVVRLGKAVWQATGGTEPSATPAGWPPEVSTNSAGEFRLDGLPASERVWLQVRDDRFGLLTFPVEVGKKADLFTLSEPRLLTGRITAQDTGRPLPGTRIAVVVGPDRQALDYYTALASSSEAAAVQPVEVDGRVDADGRYRLRLPPGISYRVYAYPPEGAPYLTWQWNLSWAEGESTRERTAALPRGVEVRGQVVEEDGKPIGGAAVLWMRDPALKTPTTPNPLAVRRFPESQLNALMYSDVATLAGADGRFRVVVPANPIVLRVFGPTADYRLCTYSFDRCPQCDKDHLRPGEHARIPIDPVSGVRAPVNVTLRRGVSVVGRAVGPDGEPIRNGVVVCRTIAQPLRKPAPRLLPIRDGQFELPGCIPGRAYPVLLLDAAAGLAAVHDIRIPGPGDPAPTIMLKKCGSAAVRLLDTSGRPLAGHRPTVWFWLPDDRPGNLEGIGPWSTPIEASWVDPLHYLAGPITDADGRIEMPAVIPGLQYHVGFSDVGTREVFSKPFQVIPDQSLWLPALKAPPQVEEGHAEHQAELLQKGSEAPAHP